MACRGVFFGGGIAPNLTAPGVTPDHTAPPNVLTASPYYKAIQNYIKDVFFYAIFNEHVYLVNGYFLTAPGIM